MGGEGFQRRCEAAGLKRGVALCVLLWEQPGRGSLARGWVTTSSPCVCFIPCGVAGYLGAQPVFLFCWHLVGQKEGVGGFNLYLFVGFIAN